MSKADAIRWPPELSFLSQTLSSTLAEIRREERVGQHLVSMLWECDTPDERDQTPVADMIEARKCLPGKAAPAPWPMGCKNAVAPNTLTPSTEYSTVKELHARNRKLSRTC